MTRGVRHEKTNLGVDMGVLGVDMGVLGVDMGVLGVDMVNL